LRVSVGHNPNTVFIVTCDEPWHAQLTEFLPVEETRIQFSTERLPTQGDGKIRAVFDFDMGWQVVIRGVDRSVPRLFLNLFRAVAEKQGFTSGLNTERDLLFSPRISYETAPARVLFINELNPILLSAQMDCLIQSLSDRRLTVTTTQPSRAGNSTWQDNRLLSDYAAIAAQCDYVVGVAGAHMAVAFSQQSINRVRGWFVIDSKLTYPFTDRCYAATSYRDAVALLKQHELC
jgi:hypothetical protein